MCVVPCFCWLELGCLWDSLNGRMAFYNYLLVLVANQSCINRLIFFVVQFLKCCSMLKSSGLLSLLVLSAN